LLRLRIAELERNLKAVELGIEWGGLVKIL
jgi:hypothetical protein